MSAYRDQLQVELARRKELEAEIVELRARQQGLAERERRLDRRAKELQAVQSSVRGLLNELDHAQRQPRRRRVLVWVAGAIAIALAMAALVQLRASEAKQPLPPEARIPVLPHETAPQEVLEPEPVDVVRDREAPEQPFERPSEWPDAWTVERCCAALRQNGSSAPPKQEAMYVAAAAACEAQKGSARPFEALAQIRGLLGGHNAPRACGRGEL